MKHENRRQPTAVHWGWVGAVVLTVALSATAVPRLKYSWRNVPVGGGGMVTGIVCHPKEKDLVYIREDVAQVRRWSEPDKRWVPLLQKIPYDDSRLIGVGSMNVDPTNPNIVYAACSDQCQSWGQIGELLKSTDRGATWQRTGLKLRMGGNSPTRFAGERIAVDPNNPSVVYYGSHNDGLFRSTRSGAQGSFQPVTTIPDFGPKCYGIHFVVIDPKSGTPGRTSSRIYAGVYGAGVFESIDAGETWHLLTGSSYPMRAVFAADGTLWVTFMKGGGLGKLVDGRLDFINPGQTNLNALSAHPTDPKIVMCAYTGWDGFGIYRTEDGGTSWRAIKDSVDFTGDLTKYFFPAEKVWFSQICQLQIDPFQPKRVWITNGVGVLRTDDITANRPVWDFLINGQEEVLFTQVISPPKGAPLLTSAYDVGGFRFADIVNRPLWNFGKGEMDASASLDYAGLNPNVVVRTGAFEFSSPQPTIHLQYSLDNAATVTPFVNLPKRRGAGRIALSADGKTVIWAPRRVVSRYVLTAEDSLPDPVYTLRTRDFGATWDTLRNTPQDLFPDEWGSRGTILSDKVNSGLFYLSDVTDLYRTTDGGDTWKKVYTQLPYNYPHARRMKVPQGMEGELWIDGGDKLLRSSNGGESFSVVPGITLCKAFGFGAPAPGKKTPSVYVLGKLRNVWGIYLSDDFGRRWVRIDSDDLVVHGSDICGDGQVYGRCYIPGNGSGVYCGVPAGR